MAAYPPVAPACAEPRHSSDSPSEIDELRKEFLALKHCLLEAGVLKEETFLARLHRTRFSAARSACEQVVGASLHDVLLGARSTITEIARAAGLEATTALLAVARAISKRLLGFVYVCGGCDSTLQPCATVECFDIGQKEWQPLQPMSVPRVFAGVVAAQGQVFVIGGYNGAETLASAERWDTSASQWFPLPDMAARRSHASAALLGSHIYVCGGDDASRPAPHSSCECLALDDYTWHRCAPMVSKRSNGAIAVFEEYVTICGGNGAAQKCLQNSEAFCPAEGAWIPLPDMAVPRAGANAAVFGHCLFVWAGHSGCRGKSPLLPVERYDPDADDWQIFHPDEHIATTPRAWTGAAAATKLAVFGTDAQDKSDDVAVIFDVTEQRWCTVPLPPGAGVGPPVTSLGGRAIYCSKRAGMPTAPAAMLLGLPSMPAGSRFNAGAVALRT